MADSLLTAAKLTAEIGQLEWSHVQRFYRDLQTAPEWDRINKKQTGPDRWLPAEDLQLPKSAGRTIWMAHPNYIARLLLALAGTNKASEAREVVQWVSQLTLGGRKRGLSELRPPVEVALVPYLQNPDFAPRLDSVEVLMGRWVTFNYVEGEPAHFAEPDGHEDRSRICWQGVIPGAVISELAKRIAWRGELDSPIATEAAAEETA